MIGQNVCGSLLLNIGSGSHKLPGFTNVDIMAGADIVADVTRGLPFDDDTVDGIYSEHFVEHLSQGDACFFFRECRRVLRPGGIVRVATPDLDKIIDRFNMAGTKSSENPLGWLNPDYIRFGFEWIANRCEMLNIAMHEWGHQWLYNQEELVRLGGFCGLTFKERHALGKSTIPWFRNLEHRNGSSLIVEFEKSVRKPFGGTPLVSVCVPAYKPLFFKEALDSIVSQTYTNLEIIISDDASHGQIAEITAPYLNDKRFVYVKNPDHGSIATNNYINALRHASGDYIKFFNDDDILEPDCVEKLVNALEANPYATLVTSTRKQFHTFGQFLPQTGPFKPITSDSSEIDSQLVMNTILTKRINFIGEPNCTLFRREDALDIRPHLLTIGGQQNVMGTPGDVVMWLNLLNKGNLIYLNDCLSYLRQHSEQIQNSRGYHQKALKAWDRMIQQAVRLGMHKMSSHNRITVTPLKQKGAQTAPAVCSKVPVRPYLAKKQRENWEPVSAGIAEVKSKRACSIIIPVFNKIKLTENCLRVLSKNTPEELYEVIIVDNASTDGTDELLGSLDGNVKIFTNATNLGFAKACNQGARAAAGDYLVFLNNDTEPQRGWLESLLDIAERDSDVAAVGSKLLYPDRTIQHAGVIIVDDRKNGDALLALNNHVNKPSGAPEANQPTLYQALTAACVLINKKAFEDVGGFDEEYWNGYEDVDLCFKLQMHGKKLVYQPESVVIHHESQSGPERFLRAKENIRRLHEKWLHAIKPDFIFYENGEYAQTDAGKIYPYRKPDAVPSQIPAPTHVAGLVSIIILTFNQLEYTRKCVLSIRRYTTEPHEIVFVDNGSTDGTVRWLRALVRENQNYRLIENRANFGFAKGCNQGIGASRGEFILLLNNDVLVSKDWLAGLVNCLNHSPNAGIVGPMTNSISGPQRVALEGYRSVDDLERCAAAFRERYRHRRIPFRRIVGFCMLFRRTLTDQIGMLDESFGAGNFEDDDYCLRAALAGYQNYIAGDVFIHHYGSRSFIGNKIDYSASISGNITMFDEKWALDLRTDMGKKVFAQNAIDKAQKLYHTGNIDKAIDAFIEGIKHAPDEKNLYYHLAEMLLDAKLYKDALDAVDSLPLSLKDDLRYLEIVACCKYGLGESGDYIERLVTADMNSPVALNLKGIDAYRRGDLGAAEDFLKQAVAADPGNALPYASLGILKWASGKDEEALDYLEKGFILSPTATEHVELYHSAVTETGQFARAESFALDAVMLYPESKKVLFFLIDLFIKQGKFSVAMDHIEKAMLTVGIDDGMLAAALEIRNRVGTKEIAKASCGRSALSLCMIVKNEEKHLARCLLSVKSVVDEMIVVDTGSTDRTGNIAKTFGAKVFDFPWSNDFSAARNYSLSMATGEWILVLDADEVISELDHPALRNIVQKKHSKPAAYAMVTRNYTNEVATRGWTANDRKYRKEEAGTGWFPSRKVRLFPNSKEIRFQNPVHELVEASVKKSGLEIRHVDVAVHHYGRFDKDKLLMKGKEYFLLGMRKLEEMKGDPKALRELAIQASELKEYETAVELWKKVIESNPNDAGAYLNISYAYLKLERYQEGLLSSRRATELDPDMKEAALNYADSEFIIGDVSTVISVLEKVLQKDPDYPPAIALLAAALYTTGQRCTGSSLFERLRKKGFHCAEFLHLHYEGAISQGREDQAIMLLQAAVDSGFITEDTERLLDQHKRKANVLIADNRSGIPGTAISQAPI